ncbi:MAG: MDR family MFS transporter [Actinomycetota bacterium]
MAAPPLNLWRDIRTLPRPAWVLFAGSFVNRFGSFVTVFLVLYLVESGYSVAQAGLAASAYGAGSLVSALVGGYLADRLGRRRTIALSMFGAAGAALLLSQAEGLGRIIPLTAVFGMLSELQRPASAALLADVVPQGRRLTAFAGYRLAINAGYAFGPAVAGYLAERSFFLLFVGEAVTSAVLGVVALVALPEGVRWRRSEERRGESIRSIAADRRFLLFLFATVLAAFVYMQSGATLPLHVRELGLGTSTYGWLISLNGVLIVALEFPLIGITRRFAAPGVIATGVVVTGIGFALTGAAHTALLLALTVVIWTFGEMVAAPVGNAYVADLAPAHMRGRYQGAYGLTFALGFVLAPALGTRLFAWSPGGLWLICGILGLVSGAMILASPRRRTRPDLAQVDLGPEVPGTPR